MATRRWLNRFAVEVIKISARTSREVECTRVLLSHPREPVHFLDLEGAEATGNLWSTRGRVAAALALQTERSEERRVGKECRL